MFNNIEYLWKALNRKQFRMVKSSNSGARWLERQHKLHDLKQPKLQLFHVVTVLREKIKYKCLTHSKDLINAGYNH